MLEGIRLQRIVLCVVSPRYLSSMKRWEKLNSKLINKGNNFFYQSDWNTNINTDI